jgi:serine/threonine protein kinase
METQEDQRLGKYLLGEVLGTGATGSVRYALNSETGERVAIKIINKKKIGKTPGQIEQIEKEILLMKGLKCANVVALRSVLRTPQNICIVMECLAGGSLLDLLMGSGRLSENQARSYFDQLLEAMQHCHAAGVYHRDLKPDNILLSSDMLSIKVADFGLATLLDNRGDRCKSRCGSTQYAAPEVFSADSKPYLPGPADVWGCGLILYIMVAGFPPFSDSSPLKLIEKICAAGVKFPLWFSASLKDLLRKILKANPEDRFTLEEIRNHDWFVETKSVWKRVSSPSQRMNSPKLLLNNTMARESASPIPYGTSSSTPQHEVSTSGTIDVSEGDLPSRSTPNIFVTSHDAKTSDSGSSQLGNSGIQSFASPDIDDLLLPVPIVPIANAFSLINFSGAFDLTRLFQGPTMKPFTLAHSTKFVWHGTTVTQAFHTLVEVMQLLNLSLKKLEQSGSLVASGWSAVGEASCCFRVQLYTLLPEAPLVEFEFISGSELAYNSFYNDISRRTLRHSQRLQSFEESLIEDPGNW